MNPAEPVSLFADDPVIAWFALLALMLILAHLMKAPAVKPGRCVRGGVESAALD